MMVVNCLYQIAAGKMRGAHSYPGYSQSNFSLELITLLFYSFSVDWWSYGVLLFEMVIGRF